MTEKTRGLPLHTQMLIGFAIGLAAGLIVHATAGPDAPWVVALTTYVTQPIGQIFLRLLFMLVIPLLFSALVVGVSEMGDIASLGRAGWRTLALTVLLSSARWCSASRWSTSAARRRRRPRDGPAHAGGRAEGRPLAAGVGAPALEGPQAIVELIPSNIFTAASENQILPVMVFALLFGIGLVLTKTPSAERVREVLDGVFHIAMTLINIVIRFAPIAIACLIFNLAALFGWELLQRLGAYVGVVVLALAIHLFVVYPIALRLLGGMSPVRFFRDVQEAMLVAFSTASSNATLPTALRIAETKLHLPRRISRFVLTVGATANQNGTALFEGVTVLFLAQLFGVELGLGQQITVMLVCILAGHRHRRRARGSLPWWPSSSAWSACRPKPSA
jgi:DAACS family dicarboxylate/amino acid:cation (Na+ or H+) symporter